MKLQFKLPKLSLATLRRMLPIAVALGLVALFTFTALTVKHAVTAQPLQNTPNTHKVISFDENTIKVIKGLLVVPSKPNLTNLGKSDPFN